jgi:pyruvate-formate lyase-activating enzyme
MSPVLEPSHAATLWEEHPPFAQSKAYCNTCNTYHRSGYFDMDGRVIYAIDCSRQPVETMVSSDSQLFQEIRSVHPISHEPELPFQPRRLVYLLEITDHCDMDCSFCYAECSPEKNQFLSLSQVRQYARAAKADGGKNIFLSGGEPTCHPQLIEIVSILRNEFKLAPRLITNGLNLANDPTLATRLKHAGLQKVMLQLDTLNNDTYQKMRKRNDIREKHRAIANIISAKIRLGFVATVCRSNLAELPELLSFMVSHAPAAQSVVFTPLTHVGRVEPGMEPIDRETLIHALASDNDTYQLREADLLPLPQYAPWKLAIHPDCSLYSWLMTHKGKKATPITQRLDLNAVYARLGRSRSDSKLLTPLKAILSAWRSGSRLGLMKRFYTFLTGQGGSRSLLAVSVGSFMTPHTRDEQRLDRCAGCTWSAKEGWSPVCQRSCDGNNTPQIQEGAS